MYHYSIESETFVRFCKRAIDPIYNRKNSKVGLENIYQFRGILKVFNEKKAHRDSLMNKQVDRQMDGEKKLQSFLFIFIETIKKS